MKYLLLSTEGVKKLDKDFLNKKDLSLNDLISNKFKFFLEDVDDPMYITTKEFSKVRKSNNLSYCLMDYIFNMNNILESGILDDFIEKSKDDDEYVLTDSDDENINQYIEYCLKKFENKEILLVKNNGKLFNFVNFNNIKNTIKQKYDDIVLTIEFVIMYGYVDGDDVVIDDSDLVIRENLNVDKLLDKLESLIEGDFIMVYFSKSESVFFHLCIMKDGGYNYKYFIKEGVKFNKDNKRNGFVYEYKVDELKNWLMYYTFRKGDSIGCSIRSYFKNDCLVENKKKGKKVMFKVYGLALYNNGEKVILDYLNANDVKNTYCVDYKTGKEIKPDENIIYCNINDKDDVICGFDLL